MNHLTNRDRALLGALATGPGALEKKREALALEELEHEFLSMSSEVEPDYAGMDLNEFNTDDGEVMDHARRLLRKRNEAMRNSP